MLAPGWTSLLKKRNNVGLRSGMVLFMDGNTTLGTVPLDDQGQSQFTPALEAGNHVLSAVYEGSDSYLTSNASITESVSAASSMTVLTLPAQEPIAGQTVPVTATVTSPGLPPTGTVR